MSHNSPIVIINLEHDVSRKIQMEMELKKRGISNYTFFKAINGLEINYSNNPLFSEIATNQLFNASQTFGLTLSPGAAGLYATWHEIIKLYEDYEDIIIMEDDIALSENFLQEFKNACDNAPKNYDILYLGSHSRENIINDKLMQPHDFIKLSQVQINGTFCMMLSKKGRQLIKNICFPVNDLQIDTVMYINFDKLQSYHINKSIAFFKENAFEMFYYYVLNVLR